MLPNLLKSLLLLCIVTGISIDIHAQTRHDFTMLVDDKLREYIVVKPSGAAPAGGYPVVFMFHGTSGTGEQFYNISGWKEKGQQEKFITVFPTSLKYCIVNKPSNNQLLLTKWMTGDLLQDQCPNQNQDFKDDVKFVRRMVDSIKTKFVINSSKIFAAGFSNGCSFSHKLAVQASDIFSACAGSGSILFPSDSIIPQRSIPFWNIVGTLDERFILEYGVSQLPFNDSIFLYLNSYINRMTKCLNLRNEYSKVSNQISNTYIYSKPNTGITPNRFQFTLVKDLNHIYPNGVNYPVSATNLFWDFFNQSALSNTADNQFEKLKTTISPNPANDDISITSNAEINTISVYSINGQLIRQFENIKSNSKSIDVENMPQGLCIFQIKTEWGVKTSKVLINHH
jgi:polyhydroxybutyrate depolymerase